MVKKRLVFLSMFILCWTYLLSEQNLINAQFGFDMRIGYDMCNMKNFSESYAKIYDYGFGLNKEATTLTG
ncbi:MAG: hypothetical protein DRZ76_04425, partial [Candidatus Nealsonbacteria bacterium]